MCSWSLVRFINLTLYRLYLQVIFLLQLPGHRIWVLYLNNVDWLPGNNLTGHLWQSSFLHKIGKIVHKFRIAYQFSNCISVFAMKHAVMYRYIKFFKISLFCHANNFKSKLFPASFISSVIQTV